jgi:hypothetical protein
MMPRTKKVESAHPTVSVGMHGMFRINIVEDGEVVGDSGYKHNLITSMGITEYMTYVFASSAGSQVINLAALGSASLVASNATILPGSLATTLHKTVSKTYITRAASTDGDTARYLATWVSGTSTALISNVGLYGVATDHIFCGGTYASSSIASNQAVNLTYDVIFLASTS